MRCYRHVTTGDVRSMRAARAQGLSPSAVGRVVGRHPKTVRHYAGDIAAPERSFDDDRVAELRRLLAEARRHARVAALVASVFGPGAVAPPGRHPLSG